MYLLRSGYALLAPVPTACKAGCTFVVLESDQVFGVGVHVVLLQSKMAQYHCLSNDKGHACPYLHVYTLQQLHWTAIPLWSARCVST